MQDWKFRVSTRRNQPQDQVLALSFFFRFSSPCRPYGLFRVMAVWKSLFRDGKAMRLFVDGIKK